MDITEHALDETECETRTRVKVASHWGHALVKSQPYG